jgi:hypothetical protein
MQGDEEDVSQARATAPRDASPQAESAEVKAVAEPPAQAPVEHQAAEARAERHAAQARLEPDALQPLRESDAGDDSRPELDPIWRADFMSRPPVILGPEAQSAQRAWPPEEALERAGADEQQSDRPVDEPAEGRL